MDLKSKILIAINKGLNEALDLNDFSEDDLKIQKKSLGTIILNSNHDNNKNYYQDLMNLIMSKNSEDITKEDILNCINWYKEYNILYNPLLDREEFRYIIRNIIKIYGNDVDLNWIDTSEVTNMRNLFNCCSLFNGDISKWDVSNVTNMESMFCNTKFNRDISLWNVSKVEDMSNMFCNAIFNQDINNWNVSKVKNIYYMFNYSLFNKPLNNWNISNNIDMEGMFMYSSFNQDISNWQVDKSNTYLMFDNCPIKEEYKPKGIMKEDY